MTNENEKLVKELECCLTTELIKNGIDSLQLNNCLFRIVSIIGKYDVQEKKQEIVETNIIVFGKGNKYRTVYFDVREEFSIRRYLKETGRKAGALFVTKRKPHSRLDTDDVRNLLNIISKRTGITDIHPHRFRHTVATKLVEKGCDIYYVKKILGHSNIETTLRYVHTSEIKVKNSYDKYI